MINRHHSYVYFLTVKDNVVSGYHRIIRYLDRLSDYYDYRVLDYVFSDNDRYHFHGLILTDLRIDYRILQRLRDNGLSVRCYMLRNPYSVFNVLRYIRSHDGYGNTDTFINRNVKYRCGDSMTDRLDELEERVSKLEDMVKAIYDKVVGQNKNITQSQTDTQLERIEVNVTPMTLTIQPSRKGIGIRVRFKKFVKQNRIGEFYLSLKPDEVNAIVTQLQTALEHFTNTENRKSELKIEKGFSKAVKGDKR